jgi:toxin-antitoxin system PIN domain toxin
VLVADTNVLVFAVNRAYPRHEEAAALLARWVAERTRVLLTWGIVYEFLKVATHPAIIERPLVPAKAWAVIDGLLTDAGGAILVETERHGPVLAEALSEVPETAGGRFHDLHTAVLMREHGVSTIVTADTNFHRFPWVRVVDPFTSR